MQFVNLARQFQTSTFRITLVIAGLFLACVGVLYLAIDWYAIGTLQAEMRATVSTQLSAMTAGPKQRAAMALTNDVSETLEQDPGAYALLLSPDGQWLAGNLAITTRPVGWITLNVPRPAGPDGVSHQHPVVARGVRLSDGGYLLLGQDAFALDEVRELIARAFGVGGMATLTVALAGGFLVSRRLLRRLAVVGQASQEIMRGDLSRRLPARGTGDEFDQLIVGFNALLDRISTLMETMRQVTNDIAHDLRTPLTRMRTRLEEVRRRPRRVGEYEAAIDHSIADTEALLETFAALLRIAQIETIPDGDTFDTVDVSTLVATVVEVYEPLAEERDQSVVGHADSFTVDGDRELLIQMLGNLVENACKHTPAGTRIQVGAFQSNGSVTLWVQDNGPGIPQEECDKVFRPFYRLDSSRGTPGNGLGLNLVAAIADRHAGSVSLSDAAPGVRVEVRIPLRHQPVARSSRGRR
jgi:signal transduction histidine kinase